MKTRMLFLAFILLLVSPRHIRGNGDFCQRAGGRPAIHAYVEQMNLRGRQQGGIPNPPVNGKTPYYSGATRAAFAAAGISYSMK